MKVLEQGADLQYAQVGCMGCHQLLFAEGSGGRPQRQTPGMNDKCQAECVKEESCKLM